MDNGSLVVTPFLRLDNCFKHHCRNAMTGSESHENYNILWGHLKPQRILC